jgi:hypothetical protein
MKSDPDIGSHLVCIRVCILLLNIHLYSHIFRNRGSIVALISYLYRYQGIYSQKYFSGFQIFLFVFVSLRCMRSVALTRFFQLYGWFKILFVYIFDIAGLPV